VTPDALPFDELLKIIRENASFALFGHINPDGDSISAVLAFRIGLEQLGKRSVAMFSEDGVPRYFRWLPGADEMRSAADGVEPVDVAVLLDCGTRKRAGESFFPFLDKARTTVNIDHHVSNAGYCDLNIIDGAASSTCEVLYHFFQFAGVEITRSLAQLLYTGIMYDTGRFKHSNTTPEVFNVCARLVALGADPSSIATRVYDHRGMAYLKMLGYTLGNMHTTPDNRIAWIAVDRATYRRLGAVDEDTEGIVEMLGAYEECEVHMFFSEAEDGRSRASMRSRGRVSVNDICAKFQGGGHRFAAGFRSRDPLEKVVDEAVHAAIEALAEADRISPRVKDGNGK
jgi:bifunctional oligoribonuclease and PAP phosphatase NrnA